MKTSHYKGWKIYSAKGGSNNGIASVKAAHPLRVGRLECCINGSLSIAVAHIKRDIDKLEAAPVSNP